MKQWILENIISLITTLFGGGFSLAYFFERKKNKAMTNQEIAKASQEEATALTNMRQAYKDFTEDMTQRYNTLSEEVNDLKKKLTDVSIELDQEKDKYNRLKSAYDTLKREFDSYKKKHSL
jgi:archaellum component FlaC